MAEREAVEKDVARASMAMARAVESVGAVAVAAVGRAGP